MPKVIIDGTEYEAGECKNMLQVILDLKLDLPYFCWHPAMGSAGACRQCAVRLFKDESDTNGKIAMACMTPARDGTRIAMNDPEAMEFRRYVIEWLMTNHPHDCPVCDEGGECHLQDMTAMCGQVYRRFRGRKRTYTNQYLGPFVTHEMNRCIQCFRCVRFYRDLAGGRDFDVLGSRNRVYFGRAEDGKLESEFSGNLVEVCPTGVFTDNTLKKHYTRKWDLQTAPSVCVHCGLGCNTIPGERAGDLRRIRARYNPEVNGYFLCDRGRYGYEFANSPTRVRSCAIDGSEASWDDAISSAARMLREAKGIVGIGSPRASLESNYALKKLAGDAFSTGLSTFEHESTRLALDIMRDGPARTPSLADVASSDVVLILGADPTNEAPMLDFAIRQAIRTARLDISRSLNIPDWDANAVSNALQDARGKLYTITPWSIKLDEIAVEVSRLSCDGISAKAAADLKSARQPLIVTSISAGVEVLESAAQLARTLCESGKDCLLSIIVPEANTMGMSLLGGLSVDDALARIECGEADTLVVLENDLARRVSSARFERAMAKAKNVIVLDCIQTATTAGATVLLPSPSCFECDGTLINNETRAQRFYQVFVPRSDTRPAWRTISHVMLNLFQHPPEALNQVQGDVDRWVTYEEVLRDLVRETPIFAPVLENAPPASWRSAADQKVARESHRFSGRTSGGVSWDPQPPNDPETPMAFSMEGDQNPVPGPLELRYWWPGWNSQNSITKFQIEVNGSLHESNPGKRLIEPTPGRCVGGLVHRRFDRSDTETAWLIPRPAIFGSDELSALSPAIAELSPKPEITMHPDLAAKLGLGDGDVVRLDLGGKTVSLPCKLDPTMAPNVATVPANIDATIGLTSPVALRKGPGGLEIEGDE